MDHLPISVGVSFNSSKSDPDEEAECLPGTREGVLGQIQEWVDGPSPTCLFWLNGMAGRGKTTIARSIARVYHEKQQLGASFFFSKSSNDGRKTTKFFTTIAAQLANACPLLKPFIAKAVKQNKNVANDRLRDQWKQLIFKPLSGYMPDNNSGAPQLRLVLVVDALDECESHHADILNCLAEAAELKTVRLRILVTSRPETPILGFFAGMPERAKAGLPLDEVPCEEVDKTYPTSIGNDSATLSAPIWGTYTPTGRGNPPSPNLSRKPRGCSFTPRRFAASSNDTIRGPRNSSSNRSCRPSRARTRG